MVVTVSHFSFRNLRLLCRGIIWVSGKWNVFYVMSMLKVDCYELSWLHVLESSASFASFGHSDAMFSYRFCPAFIAHLPARIVGVTASDIRYCTVYIPYFLQCLLAHATSRLR